MSKPGLSIRLPLCGSGIGGAGVPPVIFCNSVALQNRRRDAGATNSPAWNRVWTESDFTLHPQDEIQITP